MEEKYNGPENFGLSYSDYNFDFDIDLRFSAVDYILIGFCLVFIVPFIVLFELITGYPQQDTGKKALLEKKVEGSEFYQPKVCVGPCCLWSEASK